MTGAATKTPPKAEPEVIDKTPPVVYRNLTDVPGADTGELGNQLRWREGVDREASPLLIGKLGAITGRLEPSTNGYAPNRNNSPAGWMRLADVDSASLEGLVAEVKRAHPSWDLKHSPQANTIFQMIEDHFVAAQARWRREEGLRCRPYEVQ